MKELLLQYAQYNVWANKLIIDTMLKTEEGMAHKQVASSFPSLYKTMLHVWSAESIWLQRLQQAKQPMWHESDFIGSFGDGCANWEQVSAGLVQFTRNQHDDNTFQHEVQFNDRQGNPHKMPVFHVLQHVFNHSTYHRGQFVTMLRQLGETKIPGTDIMGFVRVR